MLTEESQKKLEELLGEDFIDPEEMTAQVNRSFESIRNVLDLVADELGTGHRLSALVLQSKSMLGLLHSLFQLNICLGNFKGYSTEGINDGGFQQTECKENNLSGIA